jgi:acetyl-CoA carboxylase carboxyltransferase component
VIKNSVVASELQGVVSALAVSDGDVVRRGQTLLWVESMKMEYPIVAPDDGVVRLVVHRGDPVDRDDVVARLSSVDAGADTLLRRDQEVHRDQEVRRGARPELAELRDRKALLADAARPDAVAGWHDRGRLTIREQIEALVQPGSWIEYGGLAVAAQRAMRSEEELIRRTPADGFVAGLGRVNADLVGPASALCAVAGYDYLVLAGTQGHVGHAKKDRLFDVVDRMRVPVVLFAEGGGGRPSDTDSAVVTGLGTMAFRLWAGLAGRVPRVGVASGYCFAGNAGLLGASDIVIATEGASIGMAGPAMIEGAGLGTVHPAEIGPAPMHATTGVVDVLVPDDAAAVAAAGRAVSYFQGPVGDWQAADQVWLREAVPEDRRRVFDVRAVISTLLDVGSMLELGALHATGLVTALGRLEGRPLGVLANSGADQAGAITSDVSVKAARFLRLCDAFGLPVLSLIDTPGIMVGTQAEGTGLVRHAAELFTAGAQLRTPMVAVVLRRAYGLGAQAMAGGSLLAPVLTVSWPSGEFGAMGIEGAVSLTNRRRLEAIADPQERERSFAEAVAQAYHRGRRYLSPRTSRSTT